MGLLRAVRSMGVLRAVLSMGLIRAVGSTGHLRGVSSFRQSWAVLFVDHNGPLIGRISLLYENSPTGFFNMKTAQRINGPRTGRL